jgi:hypothetical protein
MAFAFYRCDGLHTHTSGPLVLVVVPLPHLALRGGIARDQPTHAHAIDHVDLASAVHVHAKAHVVAHCYAHCCSPRLHRNA